MLVAVLRAGLRVILAALGIITVSVLLIAIHADPHLWAQALRVLNHRAQHAGTDLNARLGTWITPTPRATP